MDLLQHSFFTLLLMGLMARAFWRRQATQGLSSPCESRIVRGFVGASVFALITLFHLVLAVKTEHWGWDPRIPAGDPAWSSGATVAGDLAGRWGGFLLAYIGMAASVWPQWKKGHTPSSAWETLKRLFAGTGLLAGLAIALQVPWLFLHDFGPHIMAHLGFEGWIGYDGLTCFVRLRHVVVATTLDTLAALTLVLWLFQHLWGRAMRGWSANPS